MTDYDGFRVERDATRGVATITLDVPGKLNRVSMLARDQLAAVFAELDRDDTVRFVVLTGAGGQFTAGGDIAGFLDAIAVGRLAAREERRGARALLEAGDREAARLRLRRRARARARLRLPGRGRRRAARRCRR